ncbi:unnamed protein product [Zymoseptoria tritici ST99CH_3D7]|uniref:Uncharacterized protein n=1 Tax=Zymoseptoria tritici (strain ST99CH_3D7) TaxID=1276538 RepID=A0A1X7RSL4_ZYMT9|nr:unnamed protein product [Zymoseptoria tritici ST99CH_3D7]
MRLLSTGSRTRRNVKPRKHSQMNSFDHDEGQHLIYNERTSTSDLHASERSTVHDAAHLAEAAIRNALKLHSPSLQREVEIASKSYDHRKR